MNVIFLRIVLICGLCSLLSILEQSRAQFICICTLNNVDKLKRLWRQINFSIYCLNHVRFVKHFKNPIGTAPARLTQYPVPTWSRCARSSLCPAAPWRGGWVRSSEGKMGPEHRIKIYHTVNRLQSFLSSSHLGDLGHLGHLGQSVNIDNFNMPTN